MQIIVAAIATARCSTCSSTTATAPSHLSLIAIAILKAKHFICSLRRRAARGPRERSRAVPRRRRRRVQRAPRVGDRGRRELHDDGVVALDLACKLREEAARAAQLQTDIYSVSTRGAGSGREGCNCATASAASRVCRGTRTADGRAAVHVHEQHDGDGLVAPRDPSDFSRSSLAVIQTCARASHLSKWPACRRRGGGGFGARSADARGASPGRFRGVCDCGSCDKLLSVRSGETEGD